MRRARRFASRARYGDIASLSRRPVIVRGAVLPRSASAWPCALGTAVACRTLHMNVARRELEQLLHGAAVEAAEIGTRLAARNDWQYPCAVALRAHALEYQSRLSYYLRPGRAEQLAWHLSYHATLCTRELASLEKLFARAAVVAWQLRGGVRRAMRAAAGRRGVEVDRGRALRTLFATG